MFVYIYDDKFGIFFPYFIWTVITYNNKFWGVWLALKKSTSTMINADKYADFMINADKNKDFMFNTEGF